ncbi:MAG: site-specific DNA-methyltransferase [Bacteroidales bacterium]|nr:site-specific DNA-methyltransferase [Bacteroidales bacterium]
MKVTSKPTTILPEYEGRIKCIYIDPPYNTSKEDWVYNDNVNSPHILKWIKKVVGKEAEDLSRHDKWLCMMYPRLKLLQKLLSEDGVIFISIDDNEQANLKLICDEIFGAYNFVNNVIWEKKYSPQNDAKWLSDSHDFIVVYAKCKEIWRPNLLSRTEEMNARYKNPDNDPREVWKTADFSVRTYNANCDYSITLPSGRVVNPPESRAWGTTQGKFFELVADNRIWFGKTGNSIPQVKKFLTEVKQGVTPLTIWKYTEVGHNQVAKNEIKDIFPNTKTPFDTPKPTRLINRILQIATDPNSIILDSFAGSGTTAHAVLNLNKTDGGNRKFILVEMEDYAESITAERVKRVIDGYGDTEGTGGEFDFYELGEPVFDEDKNLNENIGEEKIREYIWFSETHIGLQAARLSNADEPSAIQDRYFLGKYNNCGYWFFYQKETETTLDDDFLKTMAVECEQYVIYADKCILPKDFMNAKNIVFKKIPRDIKKL